MKKILLIIFLILLGIQFLRPDKNESGYESLAAFEKETQIPPAVQEIMKNNCYDCHSGQTVYPWYAEVVPVSIWLDQHIEEGREHFDLTQWDSWDYKRKDHKLDELIEEVEENKMPLDSYTWIHGSLSATEKETLIAWAKATRSRLKTELVGTP